MISREELLAQAENFDLNEADVQRDYLFGWIISGIFRDSPLSEHLVLKGGNALRKGFLPGTRFSDDLDFSSPLALDAQSVLGELNRVCEVVSRSTGVAFDIPRNRLSGEQQIDHDRYVYKYRLYFRDLIGAKDHVAISMRVDMTEYDRLVLAPVERQLIHPYSDADLCQATLRCVAFEEALADKMKCLLQRRYCYDLFDLVYGAFLTRDFAVDRAQMMNVFLRKTIFRGSPRAARSLLLNLPADVYRGYWDKVLVPASSRFTFDRALEILSAGVNELFAPYAMTGRGELAFYPARLRNLILEAGADRKLLRIVYDGVARIVEPYSLSFKRRKDGVGNEYLYVYDRTGGRRSGPGIKTLLHSKIQHVTILEDVFQPRFEVQLAKAGDMSQSGTFLRRGGWSSASSGRLNRSSPRASAGPTYIVQCASCSKQFNRTRNSSKINPHKNPWGSSCPGRHGHLVDVRY